MIFNDTFVGSAKIKVDIFPTRFDHEGNYQEPEIEANTVQTKQRGRKNQVPMMLLGP